MSIGRGLPPFCRFSATPILGTPPLPTPILPFENDDRNATEESSNAPGIKIVYLNGFRFVPTTAVPFLLVANYYRVVADRSFRSSFAALPSPPLSPSLLRLPIRLAHTIVPNTLARTRICTNASSSGYALLIRTYIHSNMRTHVHKYTSTDVNDRLVDEEPYPLAIRCPFTIIRNPYQRYLLTFHNDNLLDRQTA